MVCERADVRLVPKPWGSADLRPWSDTSDGELIGELWFQRSDKSAPKPALLMKLLFTTAPLSIQVHPGDAFAKLIGLTNGKTEAWYILSAALNAKVAIGLKLSLSLPQLRNAIADRSVVDLVHWSVVHPGDLCSVPAGTIHAIGAGIVLVEIQQQSDATFRIYDFERQRELHIENALAVAERGPVKPQALPKALGAFRIVLIADQYFVLEKISLPADSNWSFRATRETWVLVLGGGVRVGTIDATKGDAIFVEDERVDVKVGRDGLDGLLAYPGPEADLSFLEELTNKTTVAVSGAAPRYFLKQPKVPK